MSKNILPQIIFLLCICLFACANVFSQTKFPLNQKVKIEIQNDAYKGEVLLEANRFIEIERNNALDLTTKVFAPNGDKLSDNNFFQMGTNSKFYFKTNEKGVYQIELKFNYLVGKTLPIDFQIRDLRNFNENDSKFIEIQNLRREAKPLEFKKDTESKKICLEKLNAALEIAKQLDDKIVIAEILSNISYVISQNDVEKGNEFIFQAIEIFKQLQDNAKLTHAYFILGNNYAFAAKPNYPSGLETFQKCVATSEKLEIDILSASCLVNIGGIHQYQGEYSLAAEFYQRAFNIFHKFGGSGELAPLQNLVSTHTALGNVPQALLYHSEYNAALIRYKRAEDCLINLQIGFLQYNLQNWQTSREIFKKSRQGCQTRKDLPNAALALIGEGATYTGEGDTEKALPILNSALEESRNIKSKLAEGTSLAAIGIYYDTIGDSTNAIKYLEDAKIILTEVGEITLLNIATETLGKNYLQIGELEKSETNFRELLDKSRRIRYQKQEASALFGLAKVADKKGNLDEARKNIEDSIKIIEAGRGQIPTDALRVSFFASVANYYDFYTDLLMRLNQKNPNSGFDKLAFQSAESSSSRSLLNQLRESGTDIRAGVSPELITKEKKLRQELNAQNAAQLKMLTSFAFPAQIEKVRNEISRLNADYEQTQAQIVATSPAFASLTQPKPLNLEEIQKQFDNDTVLLKYSLGEEKSYLFLVSQNSFKTFELPKRAEIETKVWNFRKLLTLREKTTNDAEIKEADSKLTTESADLSEILLGKIGSEIVGKRLAIIPSGALQFVPFSALQNSKNKQYLIETNEITILPSISYLAVQRSEKRNLPNKTLAVFADPVYEKEDPRLQKAKETKIATAKNETRGNEIADFLNPKDAFPKNFQRLIYSRREANQILALVSNASEKFSAIDFAANYNSATSENLQNYRYLHFATHGIFDARNPNFSGVVLSLINENGDSENGLLSLQDVYNLNLNSDLVVLSACRTGLGKQVKGEGVVGLTRGFMYAGSRRVVASLWKVQDDATADLMTDFYKNMLREGKRPAEAMRLAQIAMLKKNQYNSPFYWAAFVHYGEWK